MALTKAQRAIRTSVISAGEGAYLTKYLNPDGVEFMRLLTADHRPIINSRYDVFARMKDQDFFSHVDGRIGKVWVASEKMKKSAQRKPRAKKKQEDESIF